MDRPEAVASLPDSEVTATTVACGMAVSAGLWTAKRVAKGLAAGLTDPADESKDPWAMLFGPSSHDFMHLETLEVVCPACLANDPASSRLRSSRTDLRSLWPLQEDSTLEDQLDARVILPGDIVQLSAEALCGAETRGADPFSHVVSPFGSDLGPRNACAANSRAFGGVWGKS